MAGTTGLEPAASAVTGQRSNQLNYVPSFGSCGFWETRMIIVISYCQWFRLFQPGPGIYPIFLVKLDKYTNAA
jgi:hypothetical protein